jgi:hypothetical protein
MKYLREFAITIVITLSLLFCISSCNKDSMFNNDDSFRLKFSADTVLFDTVFTTVGSITKSFKIFNNSDKKVVLHTVELGGGQSSNYRINVDGRSGIRFQNMEMRAGDSLWVFVEVTVDPNNMTTPLLVQDSVLFYVNNSRQSVQLVAFGQDAYFHYPTIPATSDFPAYTTISGILPNDKPHVIYGLALVPNNTTLTLQAGTRLYMHHNANLVVLKDASLKIQGNLNNEVFVQGDRLDPYYRDQAGAWGRIWLSAGSIDNEIEYAVIKNGRIGLHVDTVGNSLNPTLRMSNTIIKNMSTAGLFAQGAWIEAYNCVFSNCGEIAVRLSIGGKYRFKHCTIGNYWRTSNRQLPSLLINNYYEDVSGAYQIRDISEAYFGNCILYGNREDELVLDKFPYGTSVFNVHFENCIIRTKEAFSNFPATFTDCMRNTDPQFVGVDTLYFHIAETSPAIDKGKLSVASDILLDIEGNARVQGLAPDLGAYERK